MVATTTTTLHNEDNTRTPESWFQWCQHWLWPLGHSHSVDNGIWIWSLQDIADAWAMPFNVCSTSVMSLSCAAIPPYQVWVWASGIGCWVGVILHTLYISILHILGETMCQRLPCWIWWIWQLTKRLPRKMNRISQTSNLLQNYHPEQNLLHSEPAKSHFHCLFAGTTIYGNALLHRWPNFATVVTRWPAP